MDLLLELKRYLLNEKSGLATFLGNADDAERFIGRMASAEADQLRLLSKNLEEFGINELKTALQKAQKKPGSKLTIDDVDFNKLKSTILNANSSSDPSDLARAIAKVKKINEVIELEKKSGNLRKIAPATTAKDSLPGEKTSAIDDVSGEVSVANKILTPSEIRSAEDYMKRAKQARINGNIDLAEKFELKAAKVYGITGEEAKQFVDPGEILNSLKTKYDNVVAASGPDAPLALKIQKQMDEIAEVSFTTKAKRFCRGNPKTCALVIAAALGGVAYGAYNLIGYINNGFSPTPQTSGGGGGGSGGKTCPDEKLKYGCRGDNVKRMQQKLLDCGYDLPRKGADGWFGPETRAAVKKFQGDNGLKVDGIVGKETLPALGNCKKNTKRTETETPTDSVNVNQPDNEEISATLAQTTTATGPAGGVVSKEMTRAEAISKARQIKSPYYKDQRYSAIVDLLINKGQTPEDAYNIAKSFEGKNIGPNDLERYDITSQELSDAWQKGKSLQESKIQKNYFLDPIRKRHNNVEKLVFERLIKNAK